MIKIAAGMMLLVPSLAFACQESELEVFHCETSNSKVVSVCQAPEHVVYRFGSIATPETTIRVANGELRWQRDYGSGGGSEDLHFPIGDVTYQISYAKHWDTGNHEAEASVMVLEPGKRTVEIACVAGTVRYDSESLKAIAVSY